MDIIRQTHENSQHEMCDVSDSEQTAGAAAIECDIHVVSTPVSHAMAARDALFAARSRSNYKDMLRSQSDTESEGGESDGEGSASDFGE